MYISHGAPIGKEPVTWFWSGCPKCGDEQEEKRKKEEEERLKREEVEKLLQEEKEHQRKEEEARRKKEEAARAKEEAETPQPAKNCIWMPGEWLHFSVQGC